jgi:hypothetical protein
MSFLYGCNFATVETGLRTVCKQEHQQVGVHQTGLLVKDLVECLWKANEQLMLALLSQGFKNWTTACPHEHSRTKFKLSPAEPC